MLQLRLIAHCSTRSLLLKPAESHNFKVSVKIITVSSAEERKHSACYYYAFKLRAPQTSRPQIKGSFSDVKKRKISERREISLPVADVIGAGVVDFDDDKHMLEMRADVFGGEGKRPGLLEHDGDDIVADVSLS